MIQSTTNFKYSNFTIFYLSWSTFVSCESGYCVCSFDADN